MNKKVVLKRPRLTTKSQGQLSFLVASITGLQVVFQAPSSKPDKNSRCATDSVTCRETAFIFTQEEIVPLFLPAQQIINTLKSISSTEGATEGRR